MKLLLMALGMALLILSSVDTVKAATDSCHNGYYHYNGHHYRYYNHGHYYNHRYHCHRGYCYR